MNPPTLLQVAEQLRTKRRESSSDSFNRKPRRGSYERPDDPFSRRASNQQVPRDYISEIISPTSRYGEIISPTEIVPPTSRYGEIAAHIVPRRVAHTTAGTFLQGRKESFAEKLEADVRRDHELLMISRRGWLMTAGTLRIGALCLRPLGDREEHSERTAQQAQGARRDHDGLTISRRGLPDDGGHFLRRPGATPWSAALRRRRRRNHRRRPLPSRYRAASEPSSASTARCGEIAAYIRL